MVTPAPPARVLVVDDEPMVREVVARYLALDGHDVHEAADGDAAEAWLLAHRPDLVVLDVMLPGIDGLTLLRRLRTGGDVPVILLTARTEELDRVLGLELAIDPGAREVRVAGELVTLTPKEFDLLFVLASSPRQVLSRRQLLDLVWDSKPEYQDAATVTVHVGRLRQKLETDPDHPRWITTVWGVGYRFEP